MFFHICRVGVLKSILLYFVFHRVGKRKYEMKNDILSKNSYYVNKIDFFASCFTFAFYPHFSIIIKMSLTSVDFLNKCSSMFVLLPPEKTDTKEQHYFDSMCTTTYTRMVCTEQDSPV